MPLAILADPAWYVDDLRLRDGSGRRLEFVSPPEILDQLSGRIRFAGVAVIGEKRRWAAASGRESRSCRRRISQTCRLDQSYALHEIT